MTESPRIVALVLAAGYSSRLQRFKPLAPLGRSTLIEEAIARFRTAGVRDVRVVTGHRSEELAPVLQRMGARWIFNPDHERGMFSSILAGVRSLESDVDAFFLLPVDIPLVKPRTIRMLLDAYDPGAPQIIHPRFDGRRGHPPLIPRACLDEDLPPDYPGGLRGFLERFEKTTVEVDVVDEGILLDCDTPSDYRRLLERWGRDDIPTEAECDVICSLLRVPERVIAHGRTVAEVARVLCVHLNLAGFSMNLPLIVAAGRLHDISRDQPDHARAGAAMLSEMGYPRVGAIVARHTDIGPRTPSLSEADLLYFADKCIEEDRLVSMEDRFERSVSRHADRPEVLHRIRKRLEDARRIGERIEAEIGGPPAAVIRRYERGIRASCARGARDIHLVRHGAIQSGEEPKRFIGQLDLPLNEEGLAQAEHLRSVLSGVALSAVYCSDLKRSIQTAAIIARDHGLSCIPKPELREIALGQWEGLTFDEVRQQYPREFEARGRDIVHFHPPGGESFLDCTCRVIPALHEILHETRGSILIVAHAGVNRIILSELLERSLEDLFSIGQDYGCLSVVRQKRSRFELSAIDSFKY